MAEFKSVPHRKDTSPNQIRRVMTDLHCHKGAAVAEIDRRALRKLLVACVLCLLFMTIEIVGGFIANSLAVISDGVHLLTDLLSFLISLLAMYLGHRKSTMTLNFGWHRAEVLGALTSILLLWILTGVLCYSAGLRLMDENYTIDAKLMLITSGLGVVFNIMLCATLHQHGHSHSGLSHGHSHGTTNKSQSNLEHKHLANGNVVADTNLKVKYGSLSEENEKKHGSLEDKTGENSKKSESNINIKAAFIHVLGDLLQATGNCVAAILIYVKPEWKIADPICTFVFSFLVFITTVTILRDIFLVLMEGVPRHVSFCDVRDLLLTIQGIQDIHNLRLWSLTMDKTVITVHIAVDGSADPREVVRTATYRMQEQFDMKEITIQTEKYTPHMAKCPQCLHLKQS